MYWFQGGSHPSSAGVDGDIFQRGRTFGGDMGLSRGGVSSTYPVVSGDMEYEQTAVEMGSHLGGASELHRPAYSSPQSYHAILPSSSSSFHFSAGFFDNPGFGGGWRAAPAPIGGGYGSSGMVGSGGIDADLQVLMNNDLYGTSLNAPRRFEGGYPKGSDGFA